MNNLRSISSSLHDFSMQKDLASVWKTAFELGYPAANPLGSDFNCFGQMAVVKKSVGFERKKKKLESFETEHGVKYKHGIYFATREREEREREERERESNSPQRSTVQRKKRK